MVTSIEAVIGWHHTLRPVAQSSRVNSCNARKCQIIFKSFIK
jgi:hypothetical protein